MRLLFCFLFACVNLIAQPWSDVTLSQPVVAASGAVEPDDLSGLVAWWKADSVTNTINGSDVVRWVDSSASGLVATNTASDTGGIYTNAASGQNGLPFVSFGDASIYRLRFIAPPITNFTVCIALRVIANSGYGGLFTWHETGQQGFLLNARSSASWIPHLTINATGGSETLNQQATTVTLPTAWRTIAYTYDNSTAACYTNGVADTLSAGEYGWGSVVGYIGFAYASMSWSCGEILVFNRVLDSGELASMQTYLQTRWDTE